MVEAVQTGVRIQQIRVARTNEPPITLTEALQRQGIIPKTTFEVKGTPSMPGAEGFRPQQLVDYLAAQGLGRIVVETFPMLKHLYELSLQIPHSFSLEALASTFLTLATREIPSMEHRMKTVDMVAVRQQAQNGSGKKLYPVLTQLIDFRDGTSPLVEDPHPEMRFFDIHLRHLMLEDPSLRIDIYHPESTWGNVDPLYDALESHYRRANESNPTFRRRIHRITGEATKRLADANLFPHPLHH